MVSWDFDGVYPFWDSPGFLQAFNFLALRVQGALARKRNGLPLILGARRAGLCHHWVSILIILVILVIPVTGLPMVILLPSFLTKTTDSLLLLYQPSAIKPASDTNRWCTNPL